MDDLISRQTAIEEFKKELTEGESHGNYVTICSALSFEGIRNILERLPSAQPDVHDRNVGEWDMFDLITSAYYGKMMYSKQDNGIIYSRYSGKYMWMDEAINEFLALIGGEL